jgi:hypothetical protein
LRYREDIEVLPHTSKTTRHHHHADQKGVANGQRHSISHIRWCYLFSTSSFFKSFLYGVINSIVIIPAMYGFTAIIFSHTDFAEYMPVLAKLVLFSCAVHQIMFSTLSSLPFAIGQVQVTEAYETKY